MDYCGFVNGRSALPVNYFQSFVRQFRGRIFVIILLNNLLIVGDWYIVDQVVKLTGWWALVCILAAPLITLGVIPWLTTNTLAQPTKFIWQAILHIAPATANSVGAPKPEDLHLGRELVTNLINQLYQLASVVHDVEQTNVKTSQDLRTNFVANALPLPLVVLDSEEKIVYVNGATEKYLGISNADLTGQSVYTALDMSFISEDTVSSWLKNTKGKAATDSHKWERARIGLPGQNDSLQFDLAGYYNQGNSMGYETLLVLFDHTEVYAQDDQAMSFVALSVHELRTPLTLLRGYIEVFDDELGPNLNTELKEFMRKMDASAQQLAAFVDNILNVAKIEDNQLTLQLHEENWQNVIETVVADLSLRASVRGITIKTDIAAGLPTVGVDRYSIYEVLANLLDNAIKYSKGTNEIYLSATLNKSGLVETSVKDFGLGIDVSILPHIFDKFYRNHRNRAQIGGTGLGLYLSKAIVDAHGGQISVISKVDAGSTFTFTVLPFAQLQDTSKTAGNPGITRNAHGWIKNHSLYRG
jgi:signal transduction histidine kinase